MPPKIGLTEISRSHFKQYKNPTLITQINVLGCCVNFLVIFRYIWEEIVFLRRGVKYGEIKGDLGGTTLSYATSLRHAYNMT